MNCADFLRSSYCLIVRLHPDSFRDQFGDDMMWILDEERDRGGGVRSCFDGILSLLRQSLKVERVPAPVVAGFGLLDTGWDIAPRRFVEAGIMASLILAGFMLLLGKEGHPVLGPACVTGVVCAASPRIQAPALISTVPITARSHSPVDSGKVDDAVASAVRIVHAEERSTGLPSRFCSVN